MADTRNRPRLGAMQVSPAPLNALLYDNWAVCPTRSGGCGASERDGHVWEDFANNGYRCKNGHRFDHRTAEWEVESR